MKNFLILVVLTFALHHGYSQHKLDSLLPVRGISMAAPNPDGVDKFVDFINDALAPRNLNTMVLRVDYRYQYKSRPELVDENALSEADVKRIVKACKQAGISIIPQVNMLGHQSWFNDVGKLLQEYPQFNETPEVPVDRDIEWPNEWGLYCLSYCPLHPEVHEVIFDVIDEIVEVFEADAFHAGMDEVFFLGMDERCKGRDNAELFAGEVTALRNHLARNNKKLWIWGDSLIDGRTTGIGLWEASYNNTHRAIDMIPKDVVINDWHYERPDPTAAYFALKGFNVVTCPWRFPDVTIKQLQMMVDFKEGATDEVKDRYQGMMHTVWTSAENTIEQFYGRQDANSSRGGNWVEAFKALYDEIEKLEEQF